MSGGITQAGAQECGEVVCLELGCPPPCAPEISPSAPTDVAGITEARPADIVDAQPRAAG